VYRFYEEIELFPSPTQMCRNTGNISVLKRFAPKYKQLQKMMRHCRIDSGKHAPSLQLANANPLFTCFIRTLALELFAENDNIAPTVQTLMSLHKSNMKQTATSTVSISISPHQRRNASTSSSQRMQRFPIDPLFIGSEYNETDYFQATHLNVDGEDGEEEERNETEEATSSTSWQDLTFSSIEPSLFDLIQTTSPFASPLPSTSSSHFLLPATAAAAAAGSSTPAPLTILQPITDKPPLRKGRPPSPATRRIAISPFPPPLGNNSPPTSSTSTSLIRKRKACNQYRNE
jgi:hypothetical protein